MSLGWRHSSVDLSAPSILPPRVRVTSTPSILLSIYIELCRGKDENKQNGQDWHIKSLWSQP